MNNLLSYCGLVDTRISACEKDLPVPGTFSVLAKRLKKTLPASNFKNDFTQLCSLCAVSVKIVHKSQT